MGGMGAASSQGSTCARRRATASTSARVRPWSATDGQKAALKLVGGSPLLIPVGKTTVPNLAFEVHDEMSLIVLKHGPGAPSGQEWTRYLDAFGPVAHRLEQMRILVLTDGGRPLREQQAPMNALVAGRSVRTAVVSSSMAVRFVISVFALMNPGIRGFPSSHLAEALEYLGLNPNESSLAESVARRLSRATGSTGQRAPLAP